MDEKALLEAIGKMMDAKLDPIQSEISTINARLDSLETKVDRLQDDVTQLKDDVDELKEYSEITRDGVNTLISWADDVACVVKIPLTAAN